MHDSLPAMTLRHVLERSAASWPDSPALSWVGSSPVTYTELRESANALAVWLEEQGVGFGDAVAILSENCPHWGMVYFAVTSMGAVAVPILTEFHPEAIQYIIRHSEAKIVFVSEKLFSKVEDAEFTPAPLFVNMETFQAMEQGITRDRLKDLKSVGLREFRKITEQVLRLARMIPREPGEDDVAAVIYTSGTTGHSKGVVLTHKNIVYDACQVTQFFTLGPGDRLLSVLPLPHTFECTLGLVLPMLHGAHVYYLDKPPTARALLPALAAVRPTAMLAVPLIMEKLFKSAVLPKFTRTKLRRFLYAIPAVRMLLHRLAGRKLLATFGGALRAFAVGGAPLGAEVERFLREAAFPYVVGYGLTEAAPLCTGSSPGDTRYLSAGYAIKGVSVRIDKPDEKGEGEILVKGPNVMREYYKSPQNTAETLTEDGWLRTGDLGWLDQDGYVYIKGRLKNLILGPSGENIYPEEVESIFCQSPYVVEALVFQNEDRLTARVHLDQTRLDEEFGSLPVEGVEEKILELLETLRQEVNSKVSSFIRIHRMIHQPEPFEKTPTQKIKRYLYTGV